MGVSASNAYVMMNRLRGQLERSLGALLVAKTGRSDCADLDETLDSWDGEFSPLIRKRVARHVDGCPKCTVRRAAMASPLALFAGVSAFAAPAGLRERVLSSVMLEPGRVTEMSGSGGSSWLRWSILGGTGLVIIALVLFLAPDRLGEGELVTPVEAPVTATPSQSPTPTPTPPASVAPAPAPPPVDEEGDDEEDDEDDEDDEDEEDEDDPPSPDPPPIPG